MSSMIDSMMYVKRNAADIPWHKEGTPVKEAATAEEAITAARMRWGVRKFQSAYIDDAGVVHPVLDRWHTVRMDNMKALGVVGGQYEPLQNTDAFKFFDELVGEGKAIYETAGSLDEGRKVWILAKLPGNLRIMGDDVCDKYLLLANGHDGYFNIAIGLTPIRVVCHNTLTAAIEGGTQWMSARHTSGVAEAVKNIGTVMRTLNASFDGVGATFSAMASTPFTQKQARNFFFASYPNEARECIRAGRPWRGVDALESLYEAGTGTDLPGVRGTLWAAYNAVTEYEDYIRPVREKTSRLGRNWFGVGASNKMNAFKNANLVLTGKATFGSPEEVEADGATN